MIQPLKPWPKPSLHDDMLSELVESGDLPRVRAYFDTVFWEGRKERPDWTHLRIALLREDRPMLRLLHTWGAQPTDAEMAAFKAATGEKYPAYVKLLRSAGLRPENTSWQELEFDPAKPSRDEITKRAFQIYQESGGVPGRDVDNWLKAEAELTAQKRTALAKAAEKDAALFSDITSRNDAAKMIEQVPGEWKRVVKAFQSLGASEAVIAGGALRDLFNTREIKDVDIFLRSQGSQKKNRKLIAAAFEAAGIDIQNQQVGYESYGGAVMGKFPDPQVSRGEGETSGVRRKVEKESWKIIGGPGKTEYNFIFIEDSLDRRLAAGGAAREQRALFTGCLLEGFDIGLCQIACDGDTVVTTGAYRDDVKYKRVSLLLPNESSDGHLQRVANKYKDWDFNPAAKAALAPKPPPRRSYSNYGGY
jgi:hypothetical protein